jgi:hypothetical protein
VGSRSAVIMSFFGAVFLALTFAWQWHVSGPALLLPFLIFAVVGFAARHALRQPGSGIVLSRKAKRTFLLASTGEGIGIFVAMNIVINMHRPEWRLPAMALVVGLHFLPIAYGTAFRPYYILGAALIAVALIGFAMPTPFGGAFSGVAAATCLWGASVIAVLLDGGMTMIRARPA